MRLAKLSGAKRPRHELLARVILKCPQVSQVVVPIHTIFFQGLMAFDNAIIISYNFIHQIEPPDLNILIFSNCVSIVTLDKGVYFCASRPNYP